MTFGSIYVQSGTVGLASYHFEEEECYISYSAAPSSWKLDNGCALPLKKPFQNVSFNASCRTFTAVVDWCPVAFAGDVKWVYRIVFSADYAHIESGEVISYDASGKPSVSVFGCDLVYERLQQASSIFGHIYVQDGKVGHASYHFNEVESYISYSAPSPSWQLDNGSALPVKKPFQDVTFEASTRTFRAVVEWHPNAIAGDVKWVYRMVFSADYTCIENGEVISYGASGETRNMWAYGQEMVYERSQQASSGSSIFGHIYVQDGKVGHASYHFNEAESYISYSAPSPSWQLDNGSALPVKKPFQDVTFEASTRTFRAIVEWHPIALDGDVKWVLSNGVLCRLHMYRKGRSHLVWCIRGNEAHVGIWARIGLC